MKNLYSLALVYENGRLRVLNQQKLPYEEEWLLCKNPFDMVSMIQHLQVRGAPLIGIAAALALAQYAETGVSKEQILQIAKRLAEARPTAVNLPYCISCLMQVYSKNWNVQALVDEAERLFEEDACLSNAIAKHGASLIQSGDFILTHCNTGGLVTTGIGTALGAIIQAHYEGKQIHVYVDETRPLLQGARLTCWELVSHNIPHTLICDNMTAALMAKGMIHKIIVGADRIAVNGDTANKIGTYSLAVLARVHNIPFYIAAPRTTIDSNCPSGEEIVVEERQAIEVRGIAGFPVNLEWAPAKTKTFNPAFDVTPVNLISGFITDAGISRDIKEVIHG